jgi:hypothetical protein
MDHPRRVARVGDQRRQSVAQAELALDLLVERQPATGEGSQARLG